MGSDPAVIEKSAVLELQSGKQGLLFTRITDTTLINALSPPDGMVIYFTPAKLLLVRSNGYWQALTTPGFLNNYWSINGNNNGSVQKLGNADNYDLSIITNNTDRLRISAAGNIGIGNTSPTQKLDVNGNIKFSGALMPNNNAGTTGYLLTSNGAGAAPSWLSIGLANLGDATITLPVSGQLLQYNGSKWINNTPSFLTTIDTSNISNFYLKVRSLLSGGSGITYNAATGVISSSINTANFWDIGGNTGTNPATNFIGTADNQDLVFKTNSTERARIISSSGDIKIGSTTTGTIKATQELVLRQDGDTYGSSILRLRNRTAENGAIFETTDPSITLVDFIFKTSVNQRNIRYEARAGSARTGAPSFHIGGANPDNPTLSVGDNYAAFNTNVKIGNYNTPTEALDVTGNLRFSGALMPNNSAGTSGYLLRSNGTGTAPSWISLGLSNLSDATITSPTNGQVLQYNGIAWTNASPSYISSSRTINTTAPLTGGGDLSADRTLSISNNGISNSLIRQSAGLSVIGNSTNATANVADLIAGTDGYVLRRSGTTLGFGTIATEGITNSAVTYAKIQNISATNRLLGRATTGAGVVEEITLGSGLSYTGTTLNVGIDTSNISNFYLKVRSLLSAGSGISYNAATGAISTTINSSNLWGYDGNTVGSVKNLGTIDNYSLPFITNNIERMRIDGSGKVGIGVTDPANTLVVKDALEVRRVGSVSQLLFSNTAGTGDFRIGADGGDIFWQGGGGRNLQMGSYWTTVLAGDRQTTTFPSFATGTANTGVLIPAQRDASVPLAIQANSAMQTANLTEWRNSAGSVLNVIDKDGKVSIGGITPTANLHLKAGTATANTAPLKFTAGTNLITPENGAVEYNGTNLFITNGGVREAILTSLSSIDTSNISNFYLKVRSLNSVTSPLTYNSSTGVTGISQATTSANGYLSSTDWNTFNNKVSSNVTTLSSLGSIGTITTGTWNGSIIPSLYGGTSNAFTKFTGPTTSEKTFTLPNASATILTSNAAVTIAQGGTGQTTATAALNALLPSQSGNSGNYLTTNGTNTSWSDPGITSADYVYSYSTTTKTFSTAGTWVDLTFNSAHPQLNGWSHSLSVSAQNFTCNQTGVYQIMYSGQVNNTSSSTYELDIRATLDGTEIPGSVSSVQCSTSSNPTIANNFLASINSGQVLKLQMTGSNTAMQLAAGTYGTTKPTITLTIVRIK